MEYIGNIEAKAEICVCKSPGQGWGAGTIECIGNIEAKADIRVCKLEPYYRICRKPRSQSIYMCSVTRSGGEALTIEYIGNIGAKSRSMCLQIREGVLGP
jgi:hypothetical protein